MLDKYSVTSKDLMSLENLNREQIKKDVLALNEKTKEYNLMLTEEQVENLLDIRKYALADNSLFELDSDILQSIILNFMGSPYISKFDYDETIYQLVDVYYSLRKKFNYHITNAYIIELMRDKFDHEAAGAVELLEKYVENKIFNIAEYKMYMGEDMNG